MRRTPTMSATNGMRCNVRFVARVALFHACCTMGWGQMVLDGNTPILRTPPDSGHTVRVGGNSNQISAPLPLEVKIRDLNPASVAMGDKMTATVLVRNIGKVPIDLPCSHDFLSVFKSGNRDQRSLSADAVFHFGGVQLFLPGAVFAGSPDVPGSMCTLAPDATLTILATIVAFGDARLEDQRQANTLLSMKIQLIEIFHDGGEERTTNASKPAVSVNAIPIFWREPRKVQ